MRTTEQHRTTSIVRFAMFLALMLSFALGLRPQPALAAGVVGNGTPASCTEAALRSAANNGGKITFNCGPNPVTITLSQHLEFRVNTEIDGGGKITLSGGGRTRHIWIYQISLTLRNLTLRDGKAELGAALRVTGASNVTVVNTKFINNNGAIGTDPENAGAISIRGSTLRVENSRFEGNRGINGGAIYNLLTSSTIINSVFLNNDASVLTRPNGISTPFGFGGAIYTDGASLKDSVAGQAIIRNSVFIGNKARTNGGAVYTYLYTPDTALIENSHFENNTVLLSPSSKAAGGALHHHNGPLTLRNSTFVNNRSEENGGAVAISQGSNGSWNTSSLSNLTFIGNRSDAISSVKGNGGALFVNGGLVNVTNATIVSNYADRYGGGIYSLVDSVRLKNSIVANNSVATASSNSDQCYKTFSGSSKNLQSTGAGDLRCSSDALIVDPRLGSLGAYGGPTKTIPLLAGSPAINKAAGCPTTDQRGAARVGTCDIGAFEYGGQVATGVSDLPAPTLQSVQNTDGGPLVQASWVPVEGASHYEVQVGPETGLAEELPPMLSAEATEALMTLGLGTHLVRVRACDYAGCGAYSETRAVVVTQAPYKVFLAIQATE